MGTRIGGRGCLSGIVAPCLISWAVSSPLLRTEGRRWSLWRSRRDSRQSADMLEEGVGGRPGGENVPERVRGEDVRVEFRDFGALFGKGGWDVRREFGEGWGVQEPGSDDMPFFGEA
jgi:hypothetical protein